MSSSRDPNKTIQIYLSANEAMSRVQEIAFSRNTAILFQDPIGKQILAIGEKVVSREININNMQKLPFLENDIDSLKNRNLIGSSIENTTKPKI